ncbi:MAG TPA: hypothetical protein VFF49_08955 [Thermodesulfobacteriota bacterium]|nr:hypothetical protein [Thermodesulfobacteriota bacterium]
MKMKLSFRAEAERPSFCHCERSEAISLFRLLRPLRLLSGHTPSKGPSERQTTETFVATTVVFDAPYSLNRSVVQREINNASNGNKKEEFILNTFCGNFLEQ